MKPNESVRQTHAAKAAMASKLKAWFMRNVMSEFAALPPVVGESGLLVAGLTAVLRARMGREYSLVPASFNSAMRTKQFAHMDALSTNARFSSLPYW